MNHTSCTLHTCYLCPGVKTARSPIEPMQCKPWACHEEAEETCKECPSYRRGLSTLISFDPAPHVQNSVSSRTALASGDSWSLSTVKQTPNTSSHSSIFCMRRASSGGAPSLSSESGNLWDAIFCFSSPPQACPLHTRHRWPHRRPRPCRHSGDPCISGRRRLRPTHRTSSHSPRWHRAQTQCGTPPSTSSALGLPSGS